MKSLSSALRVSKGPAKGATKTPMNLQTSVRAFAGGGPKKPAIPATETDFDICFVGGLDATALAKFMQFDEVNYKMALIADNSRFLIPQNYFAVSHAHAPDLKLESAAVSAQVESWTLSRTMTTVKKYLPEQNKIVLSDGKEYSYKALVIASGLDQSAGQIEGLQEMEDHEETGENNVFVHAYDKKERVNRNFYHGFYHSHGDMVFYSPKFPHKGEGQDFYPLYYEQILRYDKLQGRAANNARLEFWSPNDKIFTFPYADEVAREECRKRGIDVHLGWEMVNTKFNEFGEKTVTFRNVRTDEVYTKVVNQLVVNAPSKPHSAIAESKLSNDQGLVDVNPYTLQHRKFENVFAFGDCINVNTTRTPSAAVAQNGIVKQNLKQFMEGKELNGIYDGYTFLPFYLGTSYATSFSHLHDYEPAATNHVVPHYGLFSRWYFGRMHKGQQGEAEKYSGFKKNSGPPNWQYNPRYLPLEHNAYMKKKGLTLDDVQMFPPREQLQAKLA